MNRTTQAALLEFNRQRIACWLNEQSFSVSNARTVGEFIVDGKPTCYEWLRGQIARLSRPGDRVIARNLVDKWEKQAVADAKYRASVAADALIQAKRLQSWLESLPAGALYAPARRGGYVAVLDGKLISRLTRDRTEGDGHAWYGCPYIESPRRPLQPVKTAY